MNGDDCLRTRILVALLYELLDYYDLVGDFYHAGPRFFLRPLASPLAAASLVDFFSMYSFAFCVPRGLSPHLFSQPHSSSASLSIHRVLKTLLSI